MELLTNSMLLIDGKVAKLPIPFGLRDYASVTTRDLEREGASAYIPHEDIEYMRPLLMRQLMHAEGLSHDIAQYLIDSLLSLWNDENKQNTFSSLVEVQSKLVQRMYQLAWYAQCIAGRIAPSLVSKTLGLSPKVYSSLIQSHQHFSNLR
jgi:hypothetical protein